MKFKLTVVFESDRPEPFVREIMDATRDNIKELAGKNNIVVEVSWDEEKA